MESTNCDHFTSQSVEDEPDEVWRRRPKEEVSSIAPPKAQKGQAPSKQRFNSELSDLEVVRLTSVGSLTLANPASTSVYVIDLMATDDLTFATTSFELGFEISPLGVYTHKLRKTPAETLHSLNGPGDWKTHYGKASERYGTYLVTAFFAKSDLALKQLVDYHERIGQKLNFGEASGVLRYRFRGHTATVKQSIKLAAVLFISEGCQP